MLLVLLNEGEMIILLVLFIKFNDYEVCEGSKVVIKYFYFGWFVNGWYFDFGDLYVVGVDGIGNIEVEIRFEWIKFCKIEYVVIFLYFGVIFYWCFFSIIIFVKIGEKYFLFYVELVVNFLFVKMCIGLLVNGICYSFGDEIVVSIDVKIEFYWVNILEILFVLINLEFFNLGFIDVIFIFVFIGSKGSKCFY